jgi:hypothetical protein
MLLAAGPTLLPLLLLLLAGILVAEVLGVRVRLLSSAPLAEPPELLRRSLVSARMAEVYLPRWACPGLGPMFRTVFTEVAEFKELRELRKLLREPERSTSFLGRTLEDARLALSKLFLLATILLRLQKKRKMRGRWPISSAN